MNILFLPNWKINYLESENPNIQPPDKVIRDRPYWFFKYMTDINVDIIDFQENFILHKFERTVLKNYIYQCWKAFLIRKKYDVIISHGAQSGLFYSLLATVFNSKKNPLHVIIDVGGMNGSRINKIETPLIRFALKSKPKIIYHTKSQLELYKQAYPELIQNSAYIRFGVDAEYFKPQETRVDNYVLSFGFYKRDYNTLIEAWSKVRTDTKLKIIGIDGICTDRIEYSRKVSIAELKEEIAKCLFVVIPLPVFNYSYGQMSFLQSMAMGKPVIVTRTPSSVDYLVEGKGTFYVNPYDIDDLADKISILLSEKEDLNVFGLKARKQIVEQLNEKIMTESLYSFIQSNLK